MKNLILTVSFLLICVSAQAQWDGRNTRVRSYYRADGTYVESHYRTLPNRSTWDNWSTKGNYNPYTGERGTVNPYKQYRY